MKKSKTFLILLDKAVASGSFLIDGKDGCEVISRDENTLECKTGDKKFSVTVEQMKASKKTSTSAVYDLQSKKGAKQAEKNEKKEETEKKSLLNKIFKTGKE